MQHNLWLYRLISVLSVGAVGLALVSQYMFDMQPCAWCVFQRMLYVFIGTVACLLSFKQTHRAVEAVGLGVIIAAAIAGVLSAIYQEKVAANTFSCAQTFADKVMTQSGLDAAMPWLFGIYASCMEARVKLLGIEYAWWSMAMFFMIATVGIFALIRQRTA